MILRTALVNFYVFMIDNCWSISQRITPQSAIIVHHDLEGGEREGGREKGGRLYHSKDKIINPICINKENVSCSKEVQIMFNC